MQIENSSRLSYKLMSKDDADLFFELDQDVDVMRYINNGKLPTMEEIHNIYIPRMESYSNPEKGWGIWKVSIIENNTYIGWILARPMDFFNDNYIEDNLEIGWRFKKSSWGMGYATEAARSITTPLIANCCITKFTAIAIAENQASINIMQKLGMKYIKTDIHKDPLGDDEVVFYDVQVLNKT